MSDKRLLSCPFCGGENICETIFNWNYAISCRDCGAVMTAPMDFRGYKQEELAKRWNTRKPMERIVERLENASYRTESTFDEDGYCNDDSEEVVELSKAIEIVKEEM